MPGWPGWLACLAWLGWIGWNDCLNSSTLDALEEVGGFVAECKVVANMFLKCAHFANRLDSSLPGSTATP